MFVACSAIVVCLLVASVDISNSGLYDFGALRLSPRLDNFYEKIGVKTLGLLYSIVCRLQVPK